MDNDIFTPKEILIRVKDGELHKSDAAELLISFMEGSDNPEICVECIDILEKISYKNDTIFKILENYLISDKNPSVRNAAVKVLLKNFFKEGINSIVWTIEHDNSPLVLKSIIDFIKDCYEPQKSNELQIDLLCQKLYNWTNKFASSIEIVPEEAKFFLDLEALFAYGNENYTIDTDTYTHFRIITDYKTKEPWLVLKNHHVEILNFNFFNWKYVKNHKDNIESLLRLTNLHLFLSSIQGYYFGDNISNIPVKIPDSIRLLTQIKKLNLRGNKLKEIPQSIKFLTSLEKLDLSKNEIQEIPEGITSLNSLKLLNLNNNKIKKIPESMKDLKSLKDLRLSQNSIFILPESLKTFFNALESFKF